MGTGFESRRRQIFSEVIVRLPLLDLRLDGFLIGWTVNCRTCVAIVMCIDTIKAIGN